jgi:8-oxo-dGTP pyrophosphatase MutT (NUDIX family)
MYKVFIENRPIIFTDVLPKGDNIFLIKSNSLASIEVNLFPLIHQTPADKEIHVYSKDLKKEFERLFNSYDKIEAAGGIVRRKNRFLFIKRNGFWDIPKGKLESYESIESCAVREIEEECGLKNPEIIDLICLTYHTYEYKGIPTLKKTYWFSLKYDGEKKLKPQIEEGITKIKWMKADKIEKVRKNTFSSIIEVLDFYFNEK